MHTRHNEEQTQPTKRQRCDLLGTLLFDGIADPFQTDKFMKLNEQNKLRCAMRNIGQNSVDVIKSFLDIKSRLFFNTSSKSQYNRKDADLAMLKNLFQTGLFQHPTIVKTPETLICDVIKTLIHMFSKDKVITEGAIKLPNPHMVVASTVDHPTFVNDYHILLHSQDKNDILSFDFSSSYWEQICFQWSDIKDDVEQIATIFYGFPLIIKTSSEDDHDKNPEGLFISEVEEGSFFFCPRQDLQLHIYNPRFSQVDFFDKYPNGIPFI